MAQQVCLMSKIKDLGEEGDVVSVADGYARNYLYPQKLAAPVNAATRRQLERKIAERQKVLEGELAVAKSLAGRIGAASCTITMKAGPEGKLFGSVNSGDIAKALQDQGVELDKLLIELAEPLKELGVFKLNVKLHKQVNATLKVWIVEE